MEVAEYPLGPEVHAALTGIAVRQFDDRDALRPEKQQQRQRPQPHRYSAVGGDGRNHIEVNDGHNK